MTQQYDNPEDYIKSAELLYSEADVDKAIDELAKKLNQHYRKGSPIVLSVMGGAIVFTGLLLPKLTFPLEFDYVQATRYRGNVVGDQLHWIIKPNEKVANRKVLILDDILDEGVTLKNIVEECEALGATEIKVAVLVNKTLTKEKPIYADYVGIDVEDRYVFGCGMDVYGWWRNTHEIYALKNT